MSVGICHMSAPTISQRDMHSYGIYPQSYTHTLNTHALNTHTLICHTLAQSFDFSVEDNSADKSGAEELLPHLLPQVVPQEVLPQTQQANETAMRAPSISPSAATQHQIPLSTQHSLSEKEEENEVEEEEEEEEVAQVEEGELACAAVSTPPLSPSPPSGAHDGTPHATTHDMAHEVVADGITRHGQERHSSQHPPLSPPHPHAQQAAGGTRETREAQEAAQEAVEAVAGEEARAKARTIVDLSDALLAQGVCQCMSCVLGKKHGWSR